MIHCRSEVAICPPRRDLVRGKPLADGTGRPGGRRPALRPALAGLVLTLVAACTPASAQNCSVFRNSGGVVRGEITDMSPDRIVVTTDRGPVDVPSGEVRNITWSQPPGELTRAVSRFDNQRFDEGLAELQQIRQIPAGALGHEVEYQIAFGSAESALGGGKIAAADAGRTVSAFLRKYPNSFYTWRLTELLGRLYLAIGRNDLAAAEFTRLTQSSSPEYRLKGDFQVALTQLASGDHAAAQETLARVASSTVKGAEADLIRLRARPLRAKALALAGQIADARAAAQQIIANENPENSALFAETYNTLGICDFQEGRMMDAALDFLHTDLLFSNQADAHAEALWYLARIWKELGNQDAAWEARETLQRLYRNSQWAAKLDGQFP